MKGEADLPFVVELLPRHRQGVEAGVHLQSITHREGQNQHRAKDVCEANTSQPTTFQARPPPHNLQ